MRNLLTPEIKDFVLKCSRNETNGNKITSFAKKIEPEINELFTTATMNMMAFLISDLSISNNVATELKEMLNAFKIALNNTFILGWLTEHLCRNNIELEKCPDLKKYLSIGNEDVNTIKSLEELLKRNKKADSKKSKQLTTYEEFKKAIESKESNETDDETE